MGYRSRGTVSGFFNRAGLERGFGSMEQCDLAHDGQSESTTFDTGALDAVEAVENPGGVLA